MSRPARFLIFLAFSLGISPGGAEEETPGEVPDFFSLIARQTAEMIKQQMLSDATSGARQKRSGELNDDILKQPQIRTSTLRAQASGSAIPSPTMFVGGFSLMMMPAPEGEAIFNRIMEAAQKNPIAGK